MRRYERKTFGARRVSSNQGDTMQQSQRNQAVQKFLDDYRSGPVPSLDKLSTDLRLIPASANSTKGTCTVCGVLLLGRQDRLCSGHWDYIFLDEIFHTLQYIAEFVEGNLNGLHITHDAWTGHWLPLYKGALSCEVCGIRTGLTEKLRNINGDVLKSHQVCLDHASFKSDEWFRDQACD
jgi:hypothetical protein